MFAADLQARKLAGASSESDGADVCLGGSSPKETVPFVAVQASFAAMPQAGAALYAPTYRAGGRLIELATRPAGAGLSPDDAARLARTLQRLGFEVARTTPVDGFASNRLLMAYLAPLVRFVAARGRAGVVNGALREAGFVRRPHHLLAALDRPRLVLELARATGSPVGTVERLLAELENDAYDDTKEPAVLLDALCISLLDAVLILRAQREVRDLTIADLIARELLDFPRHLCSLCSWLKRDRVGQALDAGASVRSLVSRSAFETARAFAAQGRNLYR
jgi:hypothetical protein